MGLGILCELFAVDLIWVGKWLKSISILKKNTTRSKRWRGVVNCPIIVTVLHPIHLADEYVEESSHCVPAQYLSHKHVILMHALSLPGQSPDLWPRGSGEQAFAIEWALQSCWGKQDYKAPSVKIKAG